MLYIIVKCANCALFKAKTTSESFSYWFNLAGLPLVNYSKIRKIIIYTTYVSSIDLGHNQLTSHSTCVTLKSSAGCVEEMVNYLLEGTIVDIDRAGRLALWKLAWKPALYWQSGGFWNHSGGCDVKNGSEQFAHFWYCERQRL